MKLTTGLILVIDTRRIIWDTAAVFVIFSFDSFTLHIQVWGIYNQKKKGLATVPHSHDEAWIVFRVCTSTRLHAMFSKLCACAIVQSSYTLSTPQMYAAH